jgi:predicted dithiol-disulfide oxidoreductase (DUF899 family)
MSTRDIVSPKTWVEARKQLLAKEKEFMRLRDELSEERRKLPWVEVKKTYALADSSGKHPLAELFHGHSQLIIYHFMMGNDWDEGCPSCSMWADGFNGNREHFAARDAAFAVVSTASPTKIDSYKKRMGWTFDWYSSLESDFNNDYHVSFTQHQIDGGKIEYNYRDTDIRMDELPGVSVFAKDEAGIVYHTYSTYSRGLDNMNVVYQYLDLLPKGRDEDELDYPQAWVRRRDQYDT